MKVVLAPGPRNEELIAYVITLLSLDRESDEWRDAYDELSSHIKESDASEVMDALYYASELREEAVKDQEEYLARLMTNEEYGHYLERMVGETDKMSKIKEDNSSQENIRRRCYASFAFSCIKKTTG